MREQKTTWSLAELAEETGLPARTIRFYIARGLLDGPAVAGRGAVYDAGHLQRLRTIQELQSRGAMLAEIGRILSGGEAGMVLPKPELWQRYTLEDDVVVLVREGAAPWRVREIRNALGEFAAKVKREEEK